jgi:DNA-binding MarR family transcriptional regulator
MNYKPNIKSRTKVDYSTLKYALDNNIFKQFVLYIKVKSVFKHSIIYDYTPSKLAKLVGIHCKTAKRYVKKLEHHGLVKFQKKNLLFVKPLYQKPTKFLYIETRPWTTFIGIQERLETLTLKSNAVMQAFRAYSNCGKVIGYDLNWKQKRKAVKRATKSKLPSFHPLEKQYQVLFTCSKIAKIFKCSKATSSNMLKRLRKHGYIETKRIVDKFEGNFFDLFHNSQFLYTFSYKNALYIDRGVQLRFKV